MKRLFLLVAMCGFLAHQTHAQEVCNDGSDNDGDGFIDCFDPDCAPELICDGNYIGNDAACQAKPKAFPKFTMALDWESPIGTTNHLNRISIGDIDHNGIPEVVSTNIASNEIYILDGQTGKVVTTIANNPKKVSASLEREVVLADIDKDGFAEIFTYGKDSGTKNYKIYAFDHNLNQLWASPDLPGNPYYVSVADFDGDGIVELYYKDEIMDAVTGERIAQSKNWGNVAAPVAVDIVGDDKLELVTGCIVYGVNLGSRASNAGTLTELAREKHYKVRQEENSTTSIADYNLDGFLDVLATGSYDKTTTAADLDNLGKNKNKNTTIFFWDVHNNTLTTYIDAFSDVVTVKDCSGSSSSAHYANGWEKGTGRINIADIDGDGQLNAVYVSGKFLYALDENLKWAGVNKPGSFRIVVNEETSGYTGCTMFDFNGDGSTEIVYRDEKYVYIIYGDGTVSNSQKCVSRTNREYPIVADVDADGSTEICVTCASDDNLSDTDFCGANTGFQQLSVVRAYKSGSEPWVPARRLWNQHGYFNVNINDDLTVPLHQQISQKAFFTGACLPGDPVKTIRPLNSFLNQSPFLDTRGCPLYAASDLVIDGSLTVTPPTCPEKNFSISFTLKNLGELVVNGNLPITFYNGDPTLPGAVRLNTHNEVLANFGLNNTIAITASVIGDGSQFKLFVVLNDDGTDPLPLTLDNSTSHNNTVIECNYGDLYSADVNPGMVDVTTTATPNNQCSSGTTPANGSASATIILNSVDLTSQFNFYWSIGSAAKPVPADYVGATYTGLAEQDYTVFAIHKTANCGSNSKTQTVDKSTQTAPVIVLTPTDNTNCKNPNGKIEGVIDGGAPTGNYTYDWYDANTPLTGPILGVSNILTGLKQTGAGFTIHVTNKSTGCDNFESANIVDPVAFTASETHTDIFCNAANVGTVTATVTGGPTGFTYYWYNGNTVKPSPDVTSATEVLSSLAAGNYTFVVENNTSKCKSVPVTATVKQTQPPLLDPATKLSDMSSCDATNAPNGAASVTVNSPDPTHTYNIEWFKGQNTLAANSKKVDLNTTSSTITSLSVGIYTIKLTDVTTGCSSTEEVTIDFAVVTPSLILAAVGDLTNCTTPNGSVTVSVTVDTPADYTFSWYNGTAVKATPDYADTDQKLEFLPIGKYTVVAVHNTKKCATSPITAEVVDNTPVINIVQNSIVGKLPTDCKSKDGVMEVAVSAIGNTSGFKIEWFRNSSSTPFATISGVTTSKQDTLRSGVYTVLATNLDNGCSKPQSFDLPFAFAQGLTLIDRKDAKSCSPQNEGSFEVKLKPTPTFIPGPPIISFSVDDYQLFFYKGKNGSGTQIGLPVEGSTGILNGDPEGTANYSLATLTPGFYTVVAVENNPLLGGCPSVPVTLEIKAVTSDPVIDADATNASKMVNTFCKTSVPANAGSGSIALSVVGGITTDYDYLWSTASNPSFATTKDISNLKPDDYTVLVTYNTATNNGCFSKRTFTVLDNPSQVTINRAGGDLATTDMEHCDVTGYIPANDGSVEFKKIEVDGSPVTPNFAGYTFDWRHLDATLVTDDGNGQAWDELNNLAVGDYFVTVTDGNTNCDVTASFSILDKTINGVGVDLVSFVVPTRCEQPANVLGTLTTAAFGSSTTGYTYSWFSGPNTAGAPVLTTSGVDGETVQTLAAGTFTVEVMNNSSKCRITDTYSITLDLLPINIVGSSSPITYCAADMNGHFDGLVDAAVVSVGENTDPTLPTAYDYKWSGPETVTGQTGEFLKIAGQYSVFAIDKSDALCVSETIFIDITEELVPPIVSVFPTLPVTNCDVTNPNGIASADVAGDFINYTFDWYNGRPVLPAAKPGDFPSGPQASDMAANFTYTVLGTNRTTGCYDTASFQLNFNPVPIPVPIVKVISDIRNCIIDGVPYIPNGSLSATVDGQTSGYDFSWTKGKGASPTPLADITPIVVGLDSGTYHVTVVDKISKCIATAPGVLQIKRVKPELSFATSDATCSEENGFASVFINTDNIQLDSIWWSDSNGVIIKDGPILSEVAAGIYRVDVITDQGCAAFKDIPINTDILPYNGISRGTPGQNDFFEIGCIDSFENNIVKIYNRAGTLVYEASHYDNSQVFFDGKSNKGVSLMGTELPDGTYFFIIDKQNGSKRVAGYIEIVN